MKLLIKNTNILTMNSKDEGILKGDLAVDGTEIAWVGQAPESFEREADKVIDGTRCLVMPGLVNAHTHAPMSLLRNYGNDLELMEWLNSAIFPAEDRMDEECAYYGSLLSIAEMIRCGCTAFEEQYMFAEQIAQAANDSGIRANISRGLVGDGEDEGSLKRLEENKELYHKWHGKGDGRIRVDFGPHAPFTCGDGIILRTIEALEGCPEAGVHIHLCETKTEVEGSLAEYGMTPIQRMEKLGLFAAARVVAAHCVHLTEEDREILAKHNVHAVHNPSSNLKLASGFAPVDDLLKRGINVAIGTDGSSSNNNVNMVEELHIAGILAKAVAEDAKAVPACEVLKMATVNGAKALGIDRITGTLEPGKAADLIIIDTDRPHWYPHIDLIAAAAYSMNSADVKTVICNGNILMEDWQIKTFDERAVMEQVEALAKKII